MQRTAKVLVSQISSRTNESVRQRALDMVVHPVLQLQRAIGNKATSALLLQRKQYSEGSKQAPFQPSETAKAQAKWVINKGFHNQAIADGTTIGKVTFAQVATAGLGTLGYEKFKGRTYCGGRTYGNNDGQLPGQTTYTEWDVAEYAQGARGTDRVVISAKGTAYFTNNHYADFVEIRSG